MRILVDIQMPPAGAPEQKKPAPPPLEDRIRNMLDLVDSGHPSHREWLTINKLYRDLKGREQNPRIENLISMIEPILSKFGYHEVASDEAK